MKNQTFNWLLEGPAWLKFAVKKQLLDQKPFLDNSIKTNDINTLIQTIWSKEKGFDALLQGSVSYKKELYWYLYFLSDIGFQAEDLNFEKPFQDILELENDQHKFLLSKEMKPDYFCISSILLTTMVRMSEKTKKHLEPHLEVIMDTQRLDGGWHCAKSRAVGQKLETSPSCVMDNLNILMLLAEYDIYINEPKLEGAINLFLEHWRQQKEWRPYGFGIGTEFKKLRYPALQYGILRVLDVLSKYPYAIKQVEFKDMLDLVLQKGKNDRYQAESVSRMFKQFDFGQTKEPSRWITFLIKRIEKRAEHHDIITDKNGNG